MSAFVSLILNTLFHTLFQLTIISRIDFVLEISWIIESWTTCSRKCGGGKQTREVYCVQDVVNGTRVRVPDNSCPKQKSAVERSCNIQECPQWFEGPWSEVCSLQSIQEYNSIFQILISVFLNLRYRPSNSCCCLQRCSRLL
jgi:hypothetical protein